MFRRLSFRSMVWWPVLLALAVAGGCESPWLLRAQSPDLTEWLDGQEEPSTRYVGDLARPWGAGYARVEGIALVTQLDGTGGDPPPSPQRDFLVQEMRSHEVRQWREVLASPNTAMVLVRGFLPPGIRKGERFDVEVRLPPRSQTSSLRGGYLMQTRLRPMELLGGTVRTGHIIALAKGPLLVDSIFQGDDDQVLETRARVLGGGLALYDRPLGLTVRSDANVMTSTLISRAINARFYTRRRGIKQPVATPKNDRIIELDVPHQYRHNIARYLQVIRNLAVGLSEGDRLGQLKLLERQLHEPTACAVAALRLEGIGQLAAEALKSGLTSEDVEVRFYSAEALAYLGQRDAVGPLKQAAEHQPAFRWHALTALAAMDDVEAGVALADLLHSSSAETRYGAFRALKTRSPDDPIVKRTALGDGFQYCVVASTGPPMVHFSQTEEPEIVVFGSDLSVSPDFLYVRNGWVIKRDTEGGLKVSHFSPKQRDQHAQCSTRVDELIRTVARLGGGYADVLDVVRAAKEKQQLDGRLVIGRSPTPYRTYIPSRETEEDHGEQVARSVLNPIPELFHFHTESWNQPTERDNGSPPIEEEPEGSDGTDNGLFARIRHWFSR